MFSSLRVTENLMRFPAARCVHRSVANLDLSKADQKEVDHFAKMSQEWWNPNGPMKPLLAMNDMRIPFIRDGLVNMKVISEEKAKGPKYLDGIKILDVGCGGGFLSVPLARLGAEVIGIDPTPDLIRVAQNHAEKNLPNAKLKFLSSTIEEHVALCGEHYDAVVSSEVVEHVAAKEDFVRSCVEAAKYAVHYLGCMIAESSGSGVGLVHVQLFFGGKPGGSIFFTTVSQSPIAWFVVVLMAEYVLRSIPRGTHEYEKLVTSRDLCGMIQKAGADVLTINGMMYNPLNNKWYWCPSDSVNYAVHAIKKYK